MATQQYSTVLTKSIHNGDMLLLMCVHIGLACHESNTVNTSTVMSVSCLLQLYTAHRVQFSAATLVL